MTAFADVLRWRAQPLATLADSLRTLSVTLENVGEDVTRARSSSWTGIAAELADGSRQRLGAEITDHADRVRRMSRFVWEAGEDVAAIVRDRETMVAYAVSRQIEILGDGSVRDRAVPLTLDPEETAPYLAARREVADGVRRMAADLVARADALDIQLSAVLAVSVLRADPPPWSPAGTTAPGQEYLGFSTGPYRAPTFTFDEDFVWGSQKPTMDDWLQRARWQAMLNGGRLLRRDLDDATAAYARYWENSGQPLDIDLAEAYHEDSAIRRSMDEEEARARAAAEHFIARGGTAFEMQSQPRSVSSENENWLKTLGTHQQWTSSRVTVDGSTVTMVLTHHSADRYNFNRNWEDVHTGISDNANGRFQEVGWARSFETRGESTRTITWTLGEAAAPAPADGGEGWNPGREDRVDSLPHSRQGDRHDRDTGRARVP